MYRPIKPGTRWMALSNSLFILTICAVACSSHGLKLHSGDGGGSGGTTSAGGTGNMGGVVGTGGASAPTVVDCGSPIPPVNWSVNAPSTTYGSTAIYSCSIGYTLLGGSVVSCQADGTWTGATPTCAPVDCGAPPASADVSVSAPTTTLGATAAYSCAAGYGASGSSTRICQADGTWSGATPTCVIANCPGLPGPNGGTVFAATLTYGSTATYSCFAGYTLSGAQTRLCQSDGTWSGAAPTCIPVDCGALVAPEDGFVSAPTTTYGSTATYSCSGAFKLLGSTSRACQPDGTWSDTSPTCAALNCPRNELACNNTCVRAQTDNNNCGTCGNICSAISPSTAQCVAGRCLVILASGQSDRGNIAVSATGVYWTNMNYGTVMTVSLNGGMPATVTPMAGYPDAIAVDTTSVYWTDGGDARAVMKVPLNGGTLTTLASGQFFPDGIAVDATSVYWSSGNAVMKVPLDGGAVATLAYEGHPECDPPVCHLTATLGPPAPSPVGIAVDARNVYWTNMGTGSYGGTVMKVPLSGGTPTTLAAMQLNPVGIAVDTTSVYWFNIGETEGPFVGIFLGSVVKMPLDGGASTALASGQRFPAGMAADATSVYWTDPGADNVLKVPLGGGTPTTLAFEQDTPWGIAVDSTSVYWANRNGGTVVKLTPK